MKADKRTLEIWTIYKDPIDYPGKFVARKFLWNKPTDEVIVEDTLQVLRLKIPQNLVRIERFKKDDPKIIETWM